MSTYDSLVSLFNCISTIAGYLMLKISVVALKICRKQLTIEKGGERGSGISVLMARRAAADDKVIVLGSSDKTWKLEYHIKIEEHTKKTDNKNKNSQRLQLRGDRREIRINNWIIQKILFDFWINFISRDYPNSSSVEIGQNTEKSPGDLRRLAVTQTSVKDHQITLVWRTRKE